MNGSPVTGPDRADAMGRRLARTADRLGMPPTERDLLLDAFHDAMEPRRARITDEHHPDYLHPARTALILMDDARVRDPDLLATAVFAETRDPGLAVSHDDVARASQEVANHLARIPIPDRAGDRLLESLLALPDGVAAVAVAERLDHARHLHLRDRAEWADYHQITRAAYAPVAARVHDLLGSRVQRWCATFERRFLDGPA